MTRVENVDVLAIGCGPFNLGLAALGGSTVEDLDVLVVDSREEFRWHPGLMFDEARLQVGFLSDLVTLVDPTHPMSFLNYMADTDRMYRFLVRESFYPSRVEYEATCSGVSSDSTPCAGGAPPSPRSTGMTRPTPSASPSSPAARRRP